MHISAAIDSALLNFPGRSKYEVADRRREAVTYSFLSGIRIPRESGVSTTPFTEQLQRRNPSGL
jgi:hypothetical protein